MRSPQKNYNADSNYQRGIFFIYIGHLSKKGRTSNAVDMHHIGNNYVAFNKITQIIFQFQELSS